MMRNREHIHPIDGPVHQAWTRWAARCIARVVAYLAALGVLLMTSAQTRAAEIVYPVADGTLLDGGVVGSYDGVVDGWSWEFDSAGNSGVVTLATETPASAVENRTVYEYDLRGVNVPTPVKAALTFTARGPSVVPFPDVTLHVYSYPADLLESPDDFSAGPAVLEGAFNVTAMQAPKTEMLDVTERVNAALSGNRTIGFRFQIDPQSPNASNQVFIDSLDAEPMTKPVLTIRSGLAGDADDDGNVDLDDFSILVDCLAGPGNASVPTTPGVGADDCVWAFDHDVDADVDLQDLSGFFGSFAP
ncbi:MAG: hypothetical protein JSU63_02700 [Phycisphaerales bacterium]|nr:MAG: hypothetical protein JSU63_02700 [Phycisphaerales bacterium]